MPVEFIQPDPIDVAEVTKAIDMGLAEGAVMFYGHMETVTATWAADTRPAWQRDGPRTDGNDRVIEIKTESTPFVWVEGGTEGPYPIPKMGPHPRGLGPFQVGFVPKTRPGILASQQGSRFGPFIFPKRVMHPGIEARRFTEVSAGKLNERIPVFMQTHLNMARSL